jgi:hypothetical protein
MFWIILLLIFGFVTGLTAKRQNRNPYIWGLAGAFFWLPLCIALVVTGALCPQCREPISNEEHRQGICPRCDWGKGDKDSEVAA